jgi:hypothetical protein
LHTGILLLQLAILDTLKGLRDSIPSATLNFKPGLWGNGDNVSSKKLDQYNKSIGGFNIRMDAATFNPSPGIYNRGYVTNQLEACKAAGIKAGVMLYVGDNMPAYMFKAGASKTTIDGVFASVITDRGTYPYYADPDYEINMRNIWKEFTATIKPYTDAGVVIYWMPCVGSTGDIGDVDGYKGVPKDAQYVITDKTWWPTFVKRSFLYADSLYNSNILMNPGNGGDYYDWALVNMKHLWGIKQGSFSHDINNDGNKSQLAMCRSYSGYMRAEFEGVDDADTTFNTACATELVFQSAYAGIDMFDVAPDKLSYSGILFANSYCGTDSLFWYAHSAIDYNGLTSTQKTTYTADGYSTSTGSWLKDFASDVITEAYSRGITVTGGKYGVRDGAGTETFGRGYWSGTGTLSLSKQVSKLRIWYRDAAGSITIGTTTISGKNTGKQVYADVSIANLSYSISSGLKIYLVEGK